MSDTPETDILEEDVHVACEFVNPPEWNLIVPSSLARSLEIRLNKALKERDEARRMATVWENLSSVWKRVALRETSINGKEEA